jgi:translation initiation factor 2 beta subunit (eIF-2beta)/eIF-5
MNRDLEELFNRLIKTVNQLPKRFFNEQEKREAIRRLLVQKQIEEQMKIFEEQNKEISKMMYGFNVKKDS